MNFLPDEDYYSVANQAALGNFDPTWDDYAMSPERRAGVGYPDYIKALDNARIQAAYQRQQTNRNMPTPPTPVPNQVMKPSVNDQVATAYNRITTPTQPVPQNAPQYEWTDTLPQGNPPLQQMLDQWGIGVNPHDKAMDSMSGYPKHVVEKW